MTNFEERYLTMKDLTQRYGLSRFAIHKWMRRGFFPCGVRFGRARRWPLSQLMEWEEAAAQTMAV